MAFCLIDGAALVQVGEEISFTAEPGIYALAHFASLDGRRTVMTAVFPPPEGSEEDYVQIGFVGTVSCAGQDLDTRAIVTRIEFEPS